jgi:hypothetical protein
LQIAARFTKSGYNSTPFSFMVVGVAGDVSFENRTQIILIFLIA